MGASASKKRNSATTNVTSADASAFSTLLGPSLVSKSGTVSTAEALAGKTVGLYFSAHWCPPCRGFTPALAKAYTENLKKKGMEIVFVSSDRDEAAMKSYHGEMPWLALPYAARKIKASLSDKYGVTGIPTLVLLKADGTLLDTNGRAKVASDPTGKWLPAPAAAPSKEAAAARAGAPMTTRIGLESVVGSAPLLATDGKTPIPLNAAVKDAPLVALYFSAHWCGPCRAFTPKLVTFAEMLKEDTGVELPIIFGSSDRDQKSFDEYFASMPWYAFPHGDGRIEALKKKYDVSGIPWLVVLDAATGDLVMNEADTDVPQGPQAYDKWLAIAKKKAPAGGAPAA